MKILSYLFLAISLTLTIQFGEAALKLNACQCLGLSLFSVLVMITFSFAKHQSKRELIKFKTTPSTKSKFKQTLPFLTCLAIILFISTNSFAGIPVNTVHDSNSASNVFWSVCVAIGTAIISAELWVYDKLK